MVDENNIDDQIAEELDDDNQEQDTEIDTDDDVSNQVEPLRYNVSSYGWDIDVDGLVKRLKRGDIEVPKFQRGSVWNNTEKSSFIESLVLGLPTPSIFLAADPSTKKMNIIDGQQRLLALKSYYECDFSLSGQGIQDDLKGLYYELPPGRRKAKTLQGSDKRSLDDATIHAVVIKPRDEVDDGNDNYSSELVQIFKRLNTSGKTLNRQEIRACIFSGSLNNLLAGMNDNDDWRKLFGNKHSRLKDIEALLRVIALAYNYGSYKPPMPKFLDDFMKDNRFMLDAQCEEVRTISEQVLRLIVEAIGQENFTSGSTFLLTRFEAVFVALFRLVKDKQSDIDEGKLKEQYERLIVDGEESVEDRKGSGFLYGVQEFVNDRDRVHERVEAALRIIEG